MMTKCMLSLVFSAKEQLGMAAIVLSSHLKQAVVLVAQRGAQLGHRQRRAAVRLRHLPLLIARRQRQRLLGASVTATVSSRGQG